MNKQIIHLHGPAGVGKTMMAKLFAPRSTKLNFHSHDLAELIAIIIKELSEYRDVVIDEIIFDQYEDRPRFLDLLIEILDKNKYDNKVILLSQMPLPQSHELRIYSWKLDRSQIVNILIEEDE